MRWRGRNWSRCQGDRHTLFTAAPFSSSDGHRVDLIAHGCPLQAIVAAFHLDECTVMDWQTRAGRHCQRVQKQLVLHSQDLEHVQADEIRVKAQGKVIWVAMAIMVSTCLWLSGVIARKRDEHLILGLMQIIRQCALARPLLICVDGFIAYVQAVQLVFRSPLPSGKRGRPWLISWPDIHIGQVVCVNVVRSAIKASVSSMSPGEWRKAARKQLWLCWNGAVKRLPR